MLKNQIHFQLQKIQNKKFHMKLIYIEFHSQ